MSNLNARKQRRQAASKASLPPVKNATPPPPCALPSILPADVTTLDLAFGGDMRKLLPPYDSIPEEFTRGRSRWCKVVSTWFFRGLKNTKWTPKPGIDTDKALHHVKAILGSWEPKHEHKEAGVAYLLSLWFDDVTYDAAA